MFLSRRCLSPPSPLFLPLSESFLLTIVSPTSPSASTNLRTLSDCFLCHSLSSCVTCGASLCLHHIRRRERERKWGSGHQERGSVCGAGCASVTHGFVCGVWATLRTSFELTHIFYCEASGSALRSPRCVRSRARHFLFFLLLLFPLNFPFLYSSKVPACVYTRDGVASACACQRPWSPQALSLGRRRTHLHRPEAACREAKTTQGLRADRRWRLCVCVRERSLSSSATHTSSRQYEEGERLAGEEHESQRHLYPQRHPTKTYRCAFLCVAEVS